MKKWKKKATETRMIRKIIAKNIKNKWKHTHMVFNCDVGKGYFIVSTFMNKMNVLYRDKEDSYLYEYEQLYRFPRFNNKVMKLLKKANVRFYEEGYTYLG